MSRLEELKEKMNGQGGYFKLSKEEKAEYQELKGDGSTVPKPIAKDDSQTITMSKDELSGLIAEAAKKLHDNRHIKEEKLFGKWSEFKEVKGNNKTATLKTFQVDADSPKGVIVKALWHKRVWNEEEHKFNKEIYKLTVRYDDGKEEEVEMDALIYAGMSGKETVELISSARKPMVKICGKSLVTPKDKGGYSVKSADNSYGRGAGGYEIDLLDNRFHEVFMVKRENGQQFEIENDYLNN